MAMFGSAVASMLYSWLSRYLEAYQRSDITHGLPVVAAILGIVCLGEHASPVQILGGLFALASV
jgi:drug/metabolite transporter (DMT)-like permease